MKKILIIVTLLACVIAFPFIKGNASKATKAVEVDKVTLRSINSSILASGRLTHEEKAILSPEVIGKVKTVLVKEGDRVSKGQLILQIDDEELRAQVERDEAQVRIGKIEIDRQRIRVERFKKAWLRNKRLLELKQISKNTFEDSALDHDLSVVDLNSSIESLSQAKAQLIQSKNRLEKTQIHSPIDGIVTTVDIKPGETAIPSSTNLPGSNLVTIANPQSMYTEVNVDEADVATIQLNDPVDVIAIAYPDNPIKGIVESIASSAKVAEGRRGRSFAVKIRFLEEPTISLMPGMSCRTEIYTTSRENILAAPIKSILAEESKSGDKINYFVFVNRDNTAHRVAIETGIADDEYQEVLSGIDAGAEIILGPDKTLQHLNEGDAISTSRE